MHAPPPLRADGRPTYIYALHDAADVSARVYVGMTTNMQRRLTDHLRDARRGIWTAKARWLAGVVARGGNYQEAEQFWIASLRAMGMPLVNLTDGGHGARGYKPSAELTARLAAGRRGRPMPREGVERGAAKRRGMKMDPATVERTAAKNRGRKWTAQERDALMAIRRAQTTAARAGYLGVRLKAGRFDARLGGIYLGRYDTAEAAARVRDEAARRFWGTDASFNFPHPGEKPAREEV